MVASPPWGNHVPRGARDMVTVKVERDASGLVRKIIAEGHALFDKHGQDIVCAAVSALLQTAAQGLQERLGVAVQYTSRNGKLRMSLPRKDFESEEAAVGARILLDCIVMGLESIARDYPGHVRLI